MNKKIKEFSMNMIDTKGDEVEKHFIISQYQDKMEYYALAEQLKFQSGNAFANLKNFCVKIFPTCVQGIELENFDSKNSYMDLLNNFFYNDPEALDILAGEVMDFQKPAISRNRKTEIK